MKTSPNHIFSSNVGSVGRPGLCRALAAFGLSLWLLSCADDGRIAGGVETTNGEIVAGRVLSGPGTSVAGVQVRLSGLAVSARGDSLVAPLVTTTDENGWYVFDEVGPGTYVIQSQAGGGLALAKGLPAGAAVLDSRLKKLPDTRLLVDDLVLGHRTVVTGRVDPGPDADVREVLVCVIGRASCVAPGSDSVYVLPEIPRGSYDLAFLKGSSVAYVPVRVDSVSADTAYIEDVVLDGKGLSYSFHPTTLDEAYAILPVAYTENNKPVWYGDKDFSDVDYFRLDSDGRLIERDLEDYTSWGFSRDIALPTDAAGLDLPVDLASHPIPIRLNAGDIVFTQARPGAEDLRFSDAFGNHLAYEIERWDPVAEDGEIWVLLDTLYGGDAGQYVTMHWGEPSVPPRSDGAKVFLRDRGFLGVWHLSESGQTFRIDDAMGRHMGALFAPDGFPLSASARSVEGIIGGGFGFQRMGENIAFPKHPALDVLESFSVSIWARNDTTGMARDQALMAKWEKTAKEWMLAVSGYETLELHFGRSGGNWFGKWVSKNPLGSLDKWHHYAATYDKGNIKLYVDGEEIPSQHRQDGKSNIPSRVIQQGAPLFIGLGLIDSWQGELDEARYWSVPLSEHQIRADFRTQKPE